ncbi:MAG: hypothetical protein CMJ77_19025 [Planctomycetaceae bacterium]|nr:hypothetical protein [Planctomycetaceae bacterium]
MCQRLLGDERPNPREHALTSAGMSDEALWRGSFRGKFSTWHSDAMVLAAAITRSAHKSKENQLLG